MSSLNILFFLSDQMQTRVLGPGNPCQTLHAPARIVICRSLD